MVKQTQLIRRQQPTNCLSVFDHFVKLAFIGLTGLEGKGTLTSFKLITTKLT